MSGVFDALREARWLRDLADGRDRAADWFEAVAAGRRVTDDGPIPLDLAVHVPARRLRAWANGERAAAIRARAEANRILITAQQGTPP